MNSTPDGRLAQLGSIPYACSAARKFSRPCLEGGASNGLRPGGARPLQVVKTQAFKLRRMNTYAAREAPMQMNDFKPPQINTYEFSPPKYLGNEHLQKNPGGGGPPIAAMLLCRKRLDHERCRNR